MQTILLALNLQEKTLESPLDCKEIQPVHLKGDHCWIFTGRTDAEAEPPILWPPDAKSWLLRKDPDVEKGWRQEEKGMTEDEMVGWHHWLDGPTFELTSRLVIDRDAWCAAVMGSQTVEHNWATELDWTTAYKHWNDRNSEWDVDNGTHYSQLVKSEYVNRPKYNMNQTVVKVRTQYLQAGVMQMHWIGLGKASIVIPLKNGALFT